MRYATRNTRCPGEEFKITHLVIEFIAFMETKVPLPFAQNLRLDPVLDLFHLIHVLLPHLFEVPLIYHRFNSVPLDQSLSVCFPKKNVVGVRICPFFPQYKVNLHRPNVFIERICSRV